MFWLICWSNRICTSCWSVAWWSYILSVFSSHHHHVSLAYLFVMSIKPLWLTMLRDPCLLVYGFAGTVEVSRLEPRQNNHDLHHGCRVAQFVFVSKGEAWWSMKKGPLVVWGVFRGWHPIPSYVGIISWTILRIPIKQPEFNGYQSNIGRSVWRFDWFWCASWALNCSCFVG